MFNMAPSSSLDLQEARVEICLHSFMKRNCNEMKLSFNQYFFEKGDHFFSLYKVLQKESHEVKSGERKVQLIMVSSASDARPIHCLGRCSFWMSLNSRAAFWTLEDFSVNICSLKIKIYKVHAYFYHCFVSNSKHFW